MSKNDQTYHLLFDVVFGPLRHQPRARRVEQLGADLRVRLEGVLFGSLVDLLEIDGRWIVKNQILDQINGRQRSVS